MQHTWHNSFFELTHDIWNYYQGFSLHRPTVTGPIQSIGCNVRLCLYVSLKSAICFPSLLERDTHYLLLLFIFFGIGVTIRTCQQINCLPYAEFVNLGLDLWSISKLNIKLYSLIFKILYYTVKQCW